MKSSCWVQSAAVVGMAAPTFAADMPYTNGPKL